MSSIAHTALSYALNHHNNYHNNYHDPTSLALPQNSQHCLYSLNITCTNRSREPLRREVVKFARFPSVTMWLAAKFPAAWVKTFGREFLPSPTLLHTTSFWPGAASNDWHESYGICVIVGVQKKGVLRANSFVRLQFPDIWFDSFHRPVQIKQANIFHSQRSSYYNVRINWLILDKQAWGPLLVPSQMITFPCWAVQVV
ncbi:hypothetical protein SODALDRAFT_354575 [Sodiomyces alkalinus F11]|uniref:Uncharacterized protein n=1 Tax=Sodiomyces alkalinus (strain CBS 110278 / VKM F-3762 / F11) TaxID=1314773 RepID=A0A3N2Q6P7_SODAK|nr:hypothetical protein SODALDRAFT_354575 [Sodiomyces alkalinus F11]ROT42422.1 hypothetical protein SODALDRAFT_354575 [Sodiomyces alkalinus F11]